jgi:hypothetical protein
MKQVEISKDEQRVIEQAIKEYIASIEPIIQKSPPESVQYKYYSEKVKIASDAFQKVHQ